MILSLNWLKDMVDIKDIPTEKIVEKLDILADIIKLMLSM